MKWMQSDFWLARGGLFLAGVIIYSALWGDGLFCPDCPDPVVDTVYVGDHVDWMYFEQGLKCWDSIFVLNEAVDSLKQHIEWLWNTREAVRNDLCIHAGHDMDDPCAGMVSIEAVEKLFDTEGIIEMANGDTMTVIYPSSSASYYDWQHLKERGQ